MDFVTDAQPSGEPDAPIHDFCLAGIGAARRLPCTLGCTHMDRDTAANLIRLYLAAGEPANDATALIAQLPDRDEQARLRRALGELMSDLYVELVRPIVREYPDLDPDSGPGAGARGDAA